MFKQLVVALALVALTSATDLPNKKQLNLAAIKIMVSAAEAEAQKRGVEVSLCIVDDSGNLLFIQKADHAPLFTVEFARRKARSAAIYASPSREAGESLNKGNMSVLTFPDYFPAQGGLPIQVDGQTIGGMAASGAKSEVDEAIVQAGIDALLKK